MATHDDLLAEIARAPDDDQPRLVLADWLEERGDPRGEFIRVQCELERLPLRDPRRPELLSRELALVRAHRKGWAGPWSEVSTRWMFRRGLLAGVRIRADRLLRLDARELPPIALERLELTKAVGRLRELAATHWLAGIRQLSLDQYRPEHAEQASDDSCQEEGGVRSVANIVGRLLWPQREFERERERRVAQQRVVHTGALAELSALLNSPQLTRLQSLAVSGPPACDATLRLLRETPAGRGLRSLQLQDTSLGIEDDELAASLPTGLSELCISDLNEQQLIHILRHGGLTAVEISPCWRFLRGLGTSTQGLPDGPLPLRRLALRGGELNWPVQVGRLLSYLLGPLDELVFASCSLEEARFEPLLTGPLRRLHALDLSGNALGVESARMVEQFGLPELVHLVWHGSERPAGDQNWRIFDPGAAALVRGALPRLATLALRGQGLTRVFVEELLAGPALQGLYDLDLRDNLLDDEAADELARRGPWPRLARLDVRRNRISPAAKRRLIASFAERVLA